MALDFERELESSIASAIRDVPYVGYYISKAQSMYEELNERGAREALEKAIDLLLAAGEDWAAKKVQYYLRFM